jgi:MerR family transcriptional regulator, light-induced transcriptional regulator
MTESDALHAATLEIDREALSAQYLRAALAGDRREALRVVVEDGFDRGLAVPELLLRVITPAQYEIGRLWQLNEISVAQEHIATAISQLVVSFLYPRIERSPRNGKWVLVACAPGELHELGARIAADFLEMDGFHVRFLGANVPSSSLAKMVRDTRPDLVVVSAATSLCFPKLREMIERLREAGGPALPILVGGSALIWASACDVPAGAVHAPGDAWQLIRSAREAVGL